MGQWLQILVAVSILQLLSAFAGWMMLGFLSFIFKFILCDLEVAFFHE